MDLKNFAPQEETIVVTLKNPKTDAVLKFDDGTPFTITVSAEHTKDYKKSQQVNLNKFYGRDQTVAPDIVEMETAASEHYARITKEWNFLYGSEVPKLTVKNATNIYLELSWIKDQIQEALTEAMDFTKA